MKSASFVLLLMGLMVLDQCTTMPPRAPGDSAFSVGQAPAYRRGYYLGYQDGKWRREDDFERHHPDYKPDTRSAFEGGYRRGYDAGQRGAAADVTEKDRAYSDGYESGRADFENGVRPSPERHRTQYTADTAADFHSGYVAGFNEARR